MDARLERKLRLLAGVVVAGAISGIAFNVAQGRTVPSAMIVGLAYGLVMSFVLGSLELFVLESRMRV
jgi:adenylate cyclase